MELKFNEAEIKRILLNHAETFGLKFNHVKFDSNYSDVKSATVSFVEPEFSTIYDDQAAA